MNTNRLINYDMRSTHQYLGGVPIGSYTTLPDDYFTKGYKMFVTGINTIVHMRGNI